ncbi:hypothetical protein T01_14378 [Trichinella spiralis]|uniref:Uncharacterized protein n=1 Tax=Trichinella spiralis TaxID=6334 RepID=A0A0V0ZGY5_TRISP|nr:hypothetical protein T01_14378 [Trichinella spiralis]
MGKMGNTTITWKKSISKLTVKSLSYWFSFYLAVKSLSYWFSLSNCSLIQTLQL